MAGHSCPRTLSSFMHGHTLTLYDYTGRPNNRVCDICNEPAQGLLYRCRRESNSQGRPCGFDVHPLCTLLPRHLQHALHPRHLLILNPSANRPCAVCRRICTRWRYSCNTCDFDIHPECVLKRSVQSPPNASRPQLRRVQLPPQQQRRTGPPQQRVAAVGGPPNNNHYNHFTPNLHYQHANHRPQYYVQHNNSAIVQRPFYNHGSYMPQGGVAPTGHRSVGHKMYQIVETLVLGVLSSIIFGMLGLDFSAFM